ncbi:MAG: DUF1576 domain-containing protein [Oscillospiraceae bacterium]|nr:DUF1576 domain-containing protein [Oscillospiraceae bacterium]
MRKWNQLPEETFLKYFFSLFSLSFLIAALFMPDRADMLPGLWRILSSPTKASTNFFSVGGYAATFLNMALVGFICTGLYAIPGRQANNAATLVTLLTIGFGSWGIHMLNMWPTILGVCLYCLVKRQPLGKHTNAMLFSTGLAPFMSELMVRYPHPEAVGFSLPGIGMALAVGLIVGYYLPSGLDNSPKIHKGFALYSAALPVGMISLLLQGLLYRAAGVPIPEAVSDLTVADPVICNTFCCILFAVFIVVAIAMGCTPREYLRACLNPQHVVHFAAAYGNAGMLMNAGVYGFLILGYFNLIGAEFNGIVFGSVFCMLSTCNSGSHPVNTLPIILGYALSARIFELLTPITGGVFTQHLYAQPLVVGICYANGLSPISQEYGWTYGWMAAAMHYCMVTTVPQLHGGMCLYNGGFTAALVCLLVVPSLERHARDKHTRRQSHAQSFVDSLPWFSHTHHH